MMRKNIIILALVLGTFLPISGQYRAGFLGLKNGLDIGFERVQFMSVRNTFDTVDLLQSIHMKKAWAPSITYTRAIGSRVSVGLSYLGFGERNVKFDWRPRISQPGHSFYGVLSRWSHNMGFQFAFYNQSRGFYAPFGGYITLGAEMEIWTNRLDQFTWATLNDASGTGIYTYSQKEYPSMSSTNKKTRLQAGFGHRFVLGKRDFLNLSFTLTSASLALSRDEITYFEPSSLEWNIFAGNPAESLFLPYSKYSMEYSFYRIRAAYGIFF